MRLKDELAMSPSKNSESREIFCWGESMRPLLRPGDRIRFVPCRIEDMRRGDVIIFTPSGRKERVVHRVLSTGPDGIRTRGDANPCRDAWELKQENIIGRAVSVERDGRVVPVAGGHAGRRMAQALRFLRKLDHWSSCVLHPVYRFLSQRGVIRRLVPASLSLRVVIIRRRDGTEKQLMLGNRMIGRLPPGAAEWRIRRPFRLLVDEHSPCFPGKKPPWAKINTREISKIEHRV